jgi:hypothetical protein
MMDKKHLLNPNDRTLRQFSGLWILFIGLVAVRQALSHRPLVALVVAFLAVVIGVAGLLMPRLVKPLFVGWMIAVFPIGWVVSRIVLGSIFYIVFTPISMIFRIIGRDALVLKPDSTTSTYWRSKPGSSDQKQYLRQF